MTDDCSRSCVAVRVRKEMFGSGSVKFYWVLIRTVSGTFLVLKNMCGSGLATIALRLVFWRLALQNIFWFFCFRMKILPKSHFGYQNAACRQNAFCYLQNKNNGPGPSRRLRGRETKPKRISATSCIKKPRSKFLKPSFENLKSENGSWVSETILDRKIWFFYTWSFFCESLRLQNRLQTANLLFGAPGFRFCFLFVFSSKYSVPLIRMSFSVMFFIVSC